MALPKINGLFRLTRNAETAYAQSGNAVVKLGLASSEKYKDKETPCFINATAFGKVGEIIAQYAGIKGTQIYLSGKLQTDQWDDKQTGQKRSALTMIVEGFDFVSNQSTNSQPNQGGQFQQSQNAGQPMNQGFGGGQMQGQNPQQMQPAGQNPAMNQQMPQQQSNDFSDDSEVPF